ncbi:MAG: DUF368 domain-containing protein [Treponema sp.]|nr:DUF368 domain-containing protein [Treponema sp.]
MFEVIKTFLIGCAVGMGNVIPGVSGSTIAVVFGIYDKFINAITLNFKKLWANRKFVIPMILGMVLGVFAFSKVVSYLYTHFPTQTNYAFTGLIIGSIPLLVSLMTKQKKGEKKSFWYIFSLVVCVAAGIAIIYLFSILEGNVDKNTPEFTVLPELSAGLAVRIFLAGLLGALAMVTPGISGSLLMLILGVYSIVISAIGKLLEPESFVHAFLLLLPNGIGVLIGVLAGAKLIGILLKKVPGQSYAVILGLLLGSAVFMFPGFAGFTSAGIIAGSILSFVGGVALAYFGSKTGD